MNERRGGYHHNSVVVKAKRMAIRQRRQRVRDMLLRNVPICEMAVRLGRVRPLISQDVKWIFDQWMRYDVRTTRKRAAKRVKQYEFAANQAMTAFERSQQNEETIRTSIVPRLCDDCKGTGFADGNEQWCDACEGIGKINVETVVRCVRGQAGDSSHLRAYIEAVKEAARIEGLP